MKDRREIPFYVSLPINVAKEVIEHSKFNNVSESWIIRNAVIEYLKRRNGYGMLAEYHNPLDKTYIDWDSRDTNQEKGIFECDRTVICYQEGFKIAIVAENTDLFPHDLVDWINVWTNERMPSSCDNWDTDFDDWLEDVFKLD